MKISFLVLVASLCLTAVSAGKRIPEKREVNVEEKTIQNEHGLDVNIQKQTAHTEFSNVNTYQEGDAVVEEETKILRTSVEGKRRGKKKVEKWVQAALVPCKDLPNIQEEDRKCSAKGGAFSILSEDNCAWDCKVEEKIVEIIEVPVEVESEVEGAWGENKKRRVRKEGAGVKKRRVGGGKGDGKECSGFKKINFSNCLLKIRGFVGFGSDAARASAEFKNLK